MGQFERAKELFKAQLDKVKKDIARNPEIRKLADQQFLDDKNANHEYPRYYVMPESNRSNWQHLDTQTRIIFVLCKSRAFTFKEIAEYLKIGDGDAGKKRVERIYKKVMISLNF